MKKGGVAAICLAIVADSPVISSSGGRIRPNRTPRPGELYDFSKTQFGKVHEVVESLVEFLELSLVLEYGVFESVWESVDNVLGEYVRVHAGKRGSVEYCM